MQPYKNWYKPKTLKVTVESYKEEHPVTLDPMFKDIYTEKHDYLELIKLVKFALLITLSTGNVNMDSLFYLSL